MTSTLATAKTKTPVLSRHTWTWIVILALLTLANCYCLGVIEGSFPSVISYNTAYWFGTVFDIVLAVLAFLAARTIGIHEKIGKTWLLVSLAVTTYALGDVIWTVVFLYLGQDPYPGTADIFYALEYVFLFWAMLLAIKSYKNLVRLRTPVVVGGIVALVGTAILYGGLLAPYVFPEATHLSFWETAADTFYPLGDILLLLAPAIVLILVIRQLDTGRLSWPWWIVGASSVVLAFSDAAYSYSDWTDTAVTVFSETGWTVSLVLLTIATLVARDVYHPSSFD